MRVLYVNPRSGKGRGSQVAQEADVKIGAPLCSDALTPADGPCPTYLQMIHYNIDSIVAALTP